MKGPMIIGILVGALFMITSLHAEMVNGDLVKMDQSFFIVKDGEGIEHQIRFDQKTTITMLNETGETRINKAIRLQPGAKILTFENQGYAVYFQIICERKTESGLCRSQ